MCLLACEMKSLMIFIFLLESTHTCYFYPQLERGNSTLLPMTEMTKDLLRNITDIFFMLKDLKKVSRHLLPLWFHKMKTFRSVQSQFILCTLQEFEHHGAQLDGAGPQLIKKMNINYLKRENVDVVTEAEEHAEYLTRVTAELHQWVWKT